MSGWFCFFQGIVNQFPCGRKGSMMMTWAPALHAPRAPIVPEMGKKYCAPTIPPPRIKEGQEVIVVANQATLLSEHFTLTDLKRLIANLARAKATNRILGMGSVRSSALRMPTVSWAQLHWPIVSANPISMQALIATAGNLINVFSAPLKALTAEVALRIRLITLRLLGQGFMPCL